MATILAEPALASVNGGGGGGGGGGGTAVEDRAHQKSYKRKYKKLRHKFRGVMKRSDELFRHEQMANLAIRRIQEKNTRLLDFLLDVNQSEHIPKERRHNIGSPSRATPPRFLSPAVFASIYGENHKLLDPDDDVERMELDEDAEQQLQQQQNGAAAAAHPEEHQDNDNSSDDDDDKTATYGGSKVNSEDEDCKEAYLEEIREFKYKRGIAGTPPKSVREMMKSDADRERKKAEERAKRAAAAKRKRPNGTTAVTIKQEEEDESSIASGADGDRDVDGDGDGDAPQQRPPPPLIVEEYRRGHTPEYLRSGSPLLMSLEAEEEWYDGIDGKYDGGIPPLESPDSPSAAKAEGDPRNPMSVYCWLRKNQPQVFLQGDEVEGGGRKPGRGRGGGRRKAIEPDSGDEAGLPGAPRASELASKLAGTKRRRAATTATATATATVTTNGNETVSVPLALGGTGTGRGRGGAKGGRKRTEGSPPPAKRQRR